MAAAGDLRDAGYSSFFVRSWTHQAVAETVPTREQLDACVLLLEQDGPEAFPYRAALPADCATVRLPALTTNLLWPFQAVNPYNVRGNARDFMGNRVLLRAIERDWDADAVLAYYNERYDEYRVDLARLGEIERERLRALDERLDVPAADLVSDVISAPIFGAPAHPRAGVLEAFGRRLFARAARDVPALAALAERFSIAAIAADPRFGQGEVPIDPGVAAELGLSWYDPAATYLRLTGERLTRDEYLHAFVETTIENRRLVRAGAAPAIGTADGFRPAIDGPATVVGPAMGMYADGFAAPQVRFALEASAPVERFTIEGYYPPQHRGRATVACTLGDASATTTVEPGNAFALAVCADLAAGARATFTLSCSETLNMLEAGTGTDNRDLGVLVLTMVATPAT